MEEQEIEQAENAQSPFKRALMRLQRTTNFDKAYVIIAIGGALLESKHTVAELWPFIKENVGPILNSIVAWISGSAHAATKNEMSSGRQVVPLSENLKQLLPFVLVLGIFIILISCLYIALFSKKTKADTDKAWDMIKFIAGFFIGTLTNSLH
jgi:hypothetical protein